MSTENLPYFLKTLTEEPGVYRMLDSSLNVLYVGKAANLKKRVTSYFTKQEKSAKTKALVSQIVSIEVSVTRSETEALLLESSLIKQLRPKYNVLMRDDKSYPFIHISKSPNYPRIEVLRCKKKPESGDYFGPYPSATAVRETMQVIQKVFQIRNCSDNYFNARSRPCLQYQIKRCSAPCTQLISIDAYRQSILDVKKFLQGKSFQILDELEVRMQDAVQRLEFEEAAKLRDQIKKLRLVQEYQGVIKLRGEADVVVLASEPGFACVLCVHVRNGEIIGFEHFFPSVPKLGLDEDLSSLRDQVFLVFISYYYLDMPSRIPELIITDNALPDQAALAELLSQLRGQKCKIKLNPRGFAASWLDFARNNLKMIIEKHHISTEIIRSRIMALEKFIKVSPITRMECFDISHTQGENTIASCVVFDEHGPKKRDYRRYNISGITPGDDYAAMEQALTRRFNKSKDDKPLPQLLLIDGGKGQVSVANSVLKKLAINDVVIIGIAKGPERKAGMERLILVHSNRPLRKLAESSEIRHQAGAENLRSHVVHEDSSTALMPNFTASVEFPKRSNEEIELGPDSIVLQLLQQLRDEAHRFAIIAHRKQRQKRSFESSLEQIEGIGAKRRQALLQRFGGIRDLALASVDEISKVRGISQELALKIYQHFR